MLGAVIGDVVGSIYEFHNHRWKAFDLFNKKMFFTDDTVMTCAVAKSLLTSRGKDIVRDMQLYGAFYPRKGYGGSFARWLFDKNPKPYYSFGNGAAMRVSPVAWFAQDEEELKELVWRVTSCTHDHPEGLKGAEVTAMCIFKALHGDANSKEEIRAYACKEYPQIANFNYEELRTTYKFNETCQETVPQAIYCFLISKNFEDCVRTCISIGGDSDTLAAIACSIAEAYYGIPKQFKKEILKYFNTEDKELLLNPLNRVYKKFGINDYIKL